jgi:hypothetical protein
MTMLTVLVELQIDGVWTDITSDVLQSDGIGIQRGRPDESATTDPSSCTMTLKNKDGKYSSRNPSSPYYGLIGRNTPVRVTVDGSVRFVGEVSGWPQSWGKEANGNSARVQVQAFGVKRRLGQGTPALRSTMYRGVTSLDSVVAYWPCEDSEGATEFASGLPEAPPMYPRGPVEMASFDSFKGSEPIAKASGVRWIGSVPAYTVTDETQINFLLAVPAGGTIVSETVCRIRGTGTAPRWDVGLTPAGSLVLRAYDQDEVLLFSSGTVFNVNGRLIRVAVELEQIGAHIDWQVWTLVAGDLVADAAGTGTLLNRTFGRVTRIGMNVAGAQLDETAIGHIVVKNALGPDDAIAGLELRAYEGETAADRISRLCGEADVPVTVTGDAALSAALGPQLPNTFLDLLHEAEFADMGVLYEPRASLGLAYRTRADMYAQDATLTLDYASGEVFEIQPTDDDDAVRNDITVSRVGGSSARAQLEAGPLSVQVPPDGIGRYDDETTVSLWRDEDLPYQASWRLHMGTVDEARYPVLGVNLAGSALVSDAGLRADAMALDVGDRVVVTDAPSWLPPGDIQQLTQGFSEDIGQFDWQITANCTPASPWNVGVWDAASGPGEARYSSNGTTLAAGSGLLLNGVSPGRASTPDTAGLDIVGDIEVRVLALLDDWTPATSQCLASKSTASGNQRSWQFNVNSTGNLVFLWSATGSATLTATSTVTPTVVNGEPLWVRAQLDVDNGAAGRTVTFWTSPDGVTWLQLGTPVTTAGVTSIFNSTAALIVGSIDAGTTTRLAGRVIAVRVRDGFGGTYVADARFDQPAGTTGFTDAAGLVWTITSPAVIDDGVIVVDTPTGPVWSDADAPYDLVIGGEVLRVTDVVGAGQPALGTSVYRNSPQAMTVTRAVNGVTKTQVVDAPVDLAKPGVYAL